MRDFIICIALFWGISTLFTSCLKDVNTVFNPGAVPAVTQAVGDGMMGANTCYGLVYAKDLNSNNSGKCLLIDFSYDASDPSMMNVNENGYYTVRLLNQTPVNQQDVKSGITDTAVLLPNEQAVIYGLAPGEANLQYFDFINNYLFLPSVYLTTQSQKVNWELSYNPNAAPSKIEDKSVYNLYLRAFATSGRTENAKDTALVALNAFNLAPLVNTVKSQGGSVERGFHIAINYISRINVLDSTQFVWETSEPLLVE